MSEKDRMRRFALMIRSGKLNSYNKNHPSYEEWLYDLDRKVGNVGADKWKALDKIDFKAIPDTTFTRDRTGAGSIEYFSADEPGISYPNGYYVLHPMPGNDVILYNPNDNNELDIRLDALHIMPEDATYDALNSLYRDRAKDSDVSYNALLRYNEDVLRYGLDNVDSYELYFNNEADGLLRNMFIEGTPEYIESKRYYPDKLLLREWNKDLLPYIDRILTYLETGERPEDILPEFTKSYNSMPNSVLVDRDSLMMDSSGNFYDEDGNVIGDSVILPEINVRAKDREKHADEYKSAFDPDGAGEFASTVLNSPLQLMDYGYNRVIDLSKGEHNTDYRNGTPVQNTLGFIGQTLSPTKWAGTVRSEFKESPWSEKNPGLMDNPYLDMMTDVFAIPAIAKGVKAGYLSTPMGKYTSKRGTWYSPAEYAIAHTPVGKRAIEVGMRITGDADPTYPVMEALRNSVKFKNRKRTFNAINYILTGRNKTGKPISLVDNPYQGYDANELGYSEPDVIDAFLYGKTPNSNFFKEVGEDPYTANAIKESIRDNYPHKNIKFYEAIDDTKNGKLPDYVKPSDIEEFPDDTGFLIRNDKNGPGERILSFYDAAGNRLQKFKDATDSYERHQDIWKYNAKDFAKKYFDSHTFGDYEEWAKHHKMLDFLLNTVDEAGNPIVVRTPWKRTSHIMQYGIGGHSFDEGGPKATYGKPYYSYNENMQIETDNGKPVLNYSATLPEVTIIPDSKKSPADRNEARRFREKVFSDNAEREDRDYTQRQIMLSQRDWDNSLEKKALGYAQDAMTGIGIGADIVSGYPIYSSLKGSRVLSEADSLPEYIEGGLWLAPIGGAVGKEAYNVGKNAWNASKDAIPGIGKSEENVVASVIPGDLKYSEENMENIFREFRNYDPSTNTFKTLGKPAKRSATKNKDKDTSTIAEYIIDPDKRFMMFEPGKYINYDIGNMSIDEVVSTFGPETEKYKKLYDIAKAHNFEGKYAEIGKDAEYNILNRFAVNKADPDVAKGIAEARGIYSIPEYRARFNRFGTLGDTFIEDALARIDNMKIQGLSKNLSIKGQHGVNGGAYTLPDATGIGIRNTDKSSYIIDDIRHETNHVGHGLRNQPAFMKYHNEKIRPVIKEGKPTDTPLAKYYDEMDEIVERSKTAVEYANKIRKEGESLDQVLERLADVNIYDSKVPSDIRQMVGRYTKDSLIKFWKNFVGATAIPVTIGASLSNQYAEGGPKVTLVDSDKVRMNNSGVFSDGNGNIIGDSIILPNITVRAHKGYKSTYDKDPVNIGETIKGIGNLVTYTKAYLNSKYKPSEGEIIDLSDKEVARIKSDTDDVSSILINDFVESENPNLIRKKEDFINTNDTLLGDRKIPLSRISTFYGIENGKLKAGPLSIFNDTTTVIPNRAKYIGKIREYHPNTSKENIHEYIDSLDAAVRRYNIEHNYKPKGLEKILLPLIKERPQITLYQNIGNNYQAHAIIRKLGEPYKHLKDKLNNSYAITESGDTIRPYNMNAIPKTLFADENGNAIFTSLSESNLNELNKRLNKTPMYPIMVDNGRYAFYQTESPNVGVYSGLDNPNKMFILGTLNKKAEGGPKNIVEHNGMVYNVTPSALQSNNLTVELPEVKVLGKRKNKGYKSAFNSNGAVEFTGTMMNSPMLLGDYAFNRFIDASKGEYGKTDYRYTPVQTTMQRVGETLSPTRWIGSAKTGFKESPWSEDNPGLWGDRNLDVITDGFIGAALTKVPYRKLGNTIKTATKNNAVGIVTKHSLQPNNLQNVHNAFRNSEWSNFIETKNGDYYYRLVNPVTEKYAPNERYFISHTTPWGEFTGQGTEYPIETTRLYEVPTETLGRRRNTSYQGVTGDLDVTELGKQYLRYGERASGKRDFVRVLSDKNAKSLGRSPFTIGNSDRPLTSVGFYDKYPIYDDIYLGNQTVVKGKTWDRILNDIEYNMYEQTPSGILKTIHVEAPYNEMQIVSPKNLRSLGKNTDIKSFYNFTDEFEPSVKLSTEGISRFQGKSPIPTGHRGLVGYRPKQKLTIWDDAANDMIVDERFRSIDDIPKLRETINSILSRVKTEDIRPEFLNENAYVNSFRDNASRQFINVNDLSHEDIAKILTEQYNQLSSTSNGILKDNVLWRTWGESLPQPEFNWQAHMGSSSGNKGFWGQGNYFGTGVYGNDIINQPYMIKGIEEIGYDDLFGATKAADEASRNGKLAGSELATKWMSESPETRMVAATEQGWRNEYGWLDNHNKGIEVVTQKNKGIKALNPDLTNGNGATFVRDWNNPNVFKAIVPYVAAGTAGYLLNKDYKK